MSRRIGTQRLVTDADKRAQRPESLEDSESRRIGAQKPDTNADGTLGIRLSDLALSVWISLTAELLKMAPIRPASNAKIAFSKHNKPDLQTENLMPTPPKADRFKVSLDAWKNVSPEEKEVRTL